MKRSVKSILFIGNTAWSMYNFRREIFVHFLQQGCDVYVAAPEDMNFSMKIQALGCNFLPVKIAAKGVNPFEDFLLMFRLILLFLRIKPDLVFTYTIKPNIYGACAAFIARVPLIAVTTGLGYSFLRSNFIAWISRILYKFAFLFPKEVWFLNCDDRNSFLSEKLVASHKAKLLNSEGINLDNFKPVTTSEKNSTGVSFILVARLLWDKGVGEFVEAAKILKKKYPETRFALLGFLGIDNPSAIPETALNDWVQNGWVEYLGVTDNVMECIVNFDCVCLPSYYREGVPRSLMEGAAMEKILIATDSVGCRNTIDDQITGFLCKVKDPVDLACCMEKVITMSPQEREKMGKAGRKKMEQEFDINHVIMQYDSALRNLYCDRN